MDKSLGIAHRQTLEDQSGKDWLVARDIGDFIKAARLQLLIDALRHLAVEQQRLGIHIDDALRLLARGGLLHQILNIPVASCRAPAIHALLQRPHPIDVGVKAKASACRSLIGVTRLQGIGMGNGSLDERADQRPGAGADVCGCLQVG